MKLNILILVICLFVGYLCSLSSNVTIKKKTELERLIDVIQEWKELDTRKE